MNDDRHQQALKVRIAAAELAANRPHPRHVANGDEQRFRRAQKDQCEIEAECSDGKVQFKYKETHRPSYLASFTKGMPHDYATGLLADPADFESFVKAIDSGDPSDFLVTRLGPAEANPGSCCVPVLPNGDSAWRSPKAQHARGGKGAKVRAWESQGAGRTFDLEGPDAQAVTMPPAPAIGSDELIAEIAEVYAQALLRDVPFTEIVDCSGLVRFNGGEGTHDTTVQEILGHLNELKWINDASCCGLSAAEVKRKRKVIELDGQTVFRGITPGDDIGPYLSQFLLAGNHGINSNDFDRDPDQGLISYGALTIDQRVRFAKPFDDHMTTWDEWFDVQQGADLRGMESYVGPQCDKEGGPGRRFITTPRDLATFVHYDALYEAYLNACLILLSLGVPFDPGIPFQAPDCRDHQQGFAHFGGPHILSLLTEVATRALKAVRFQKFNVHRRLRPEALAARLTKCGDLNEPLVAKMVCAPGLQKILALVAKKNGSAAHEPNYLLPMAFCEGSPMHPSYGAGHATVAGACVTILKAFFDHNHPLNVTGDSTMAFTPKSDGSALMRVPVGCGKQHLTVEGELNKLASNIAIGRNWAGVHYFSDYIESLRLGEQIALGILEEQKLTYGENFSMTVPLFDGGSIRI